MRGRGAPAELAVVRRGGFDESRHLGDVIVLGADGEVRLALGDPEAAMLPRSTLKPVQAEVCLDAGAEVEGVEVALAAASHTGQDFHVASVERVLTRVGLTTADLGCPPAGPTHERVRMNCSGKHAAMLAACVRNDWDVATYLDPHHPLQQRVRRAVEDATGEPIAHVTVDGCAAPLFGVTLHGLARVYVRLGAGRSGTASRVRAAMSSHPEYVAGPGEPNTETMRRWPGAVAKGGAEGVLAMVAPTGEAVAVKVADGSSRATTMIALAALRAAGVDIGGAAELLDVPVLGGEQQVGAIVPGADLPS